MNRHKWFLMGLLLVTLLLALVAPVSRATVAAQDTPLSRVRFLHAVPGGPAVDVYVNGELAVEGLLFGEVTPHLYVPVADQQIALRASGSAIDAAPLLETTVSLVPNLAYTLIAQGAPESLSAVLYEDILDPIDVGLARMTAINAIADAPPLDIVRTDGGPLLQGVNYGAQYGTVNIGAGVQDLVMVPAGGAVESAVALIGEVPLRSGVLYTFVALGTLDGDTASSALVIATPVNGAEGAALVQVAHGSPDAPAVDVYANDTLIVPALELGELTGHLAVPAGDYTLALRPAGTAATDEPVAQASVTLEADTATTVVAVGQAADETLALTAFADTIADVDPTMARLTVVNAVPDAPVSVTLSNDSVLTTSLANAAQSMVMDVAPGNYMVFPSVELADSPVSLVVPETTYVGGTYYTVLVYGGGASAAPYDARVQGTPVNVTVGSLPVQMNVSVAAATDGESLPGEDNAQAAPEVTDAANAQREEPEATEAVVLEPVETEPAADSASSDNGQNDSELVGGNGGDAASAPQATEPPQNTPQPIQPQVVPIAYVELSPDVNLHCRELPGPEMRSLGLIPGGTTLTVIGRTGIPLVPETGSATPEPTPDYEAVEDFWVSVQWDTPGGGFLRCWVKKEFIRIEYRGRLVDTVEEMWDLPEEPFNRPGENASADVPMTTPLFDAVIATVELEPGVSLQLRVYPETDAESLGLVPAQAQLEVLGYAEAPSGGGVGQPTSPYWLYVRYRTENGGATIGWVSAQYVSLSRLGREVDIIDVPLADETEAGYFEAPGEAPVIPIELQEVVGTVDLNPGANLNLRDRPANDARVVVGIPSGDSMILNGRNGDGTWVQVTYESASGDLEGWVASQYLIITRGGQDYDVADLPILTGEADAMTG